MCSTRVPDEKFALPSFRILAQQAEKMPPCQVQCPNSGDVRGWLGVIAQREKNGLELDKAYDKAWEMIAERNPLVATISRICPHPCEDLCTRRDKDDAVSINAMERFLGDWGISRSLPLPVVDSERHPETIGVVGSGPASLSSAYQMPRRGYALTVYEKHEVPGGMLRHAIPDNRLPREILDAEVERLFRLNISLQRNTDVGSSVRLEELRSRHRLVFLGLGAQAARDLGIPGEKGPGVMSGIAYLRQRKSRSESLHGQRVLVIGGGNTAIDAARSARRDGALVTVAYRRGEAEMPATAHEVADARKEGIEFRFLVSPTRVERENGRIRHVELQEMRLGEPDEQGRRRPVPVAGQLRELTADTVIVAVAQAPDWNGIDSTPPVREWLNTEANGKLADDIWAGGDARGADIAAAAIAQGRFAAESAHAELRGQTRPSAGTDRKPVDRESVRLDYYPGQDRTPSPRRPESEWLSDPEKEIDQTISYEQACQEAARCMSCGQCLDCQKCFMYCNGAGFTRVEQTSPGNYFVLALDACVGCGKCIEICPSRYIEPRAD